jgi:hypothetical protein
MPAFTADPTPLCGTHPPAKPNPLWAPPVSILLASSLFGRAWCKLHRAIGGTERQSIRKRDQSASASCVPSPMPTHPIEHLQAKRRTEVLVRLSRTSAGDYVDIGGPVRTITIEFHAAISQFEGEQSQASTQMITRSQARGNEGDQRVSTELVPVKKVPKKKSKNASGAGGLRPAVGPG